MGAANPSRVPVEKPYGSRVWAFELDVTTDVGTYIFVEGVCRRDPTQASSLWVVGRRLVTEEMFDELDG